jgi:nitrile hydratase beta subunit
MGSPLPCAQPRHGRDRCLDDRRAARYFSSSYYRKWALGLERRLLQYGLADEAEISRGHAVRPGKRLARSFGVADVPQTLTRGSYGRAPQSPARFNIGDRVRAKNIHPRTHTRLPRYARGHRGVIEAVRGCHVFPDSAATGAGENPQWLYTVLFDGRELWGDTADPTLKVSIEAFEPYLEPA